LQVVFESLNESGFVNPSTVTQNRGTMSYAAIAVPTVIVLVIIALVLVFVLKPRQLKPLGIFLIVVSAIIQSWYRPVS
jgi:glucan phosphoethanolaminetransferase (alkaline phosphatase superfamily)